MKKILPLFVICILVLTGLGAVAIPDERTIPKPVFQESHLEVLIKGGILGYVISVKNVGTEKVSGNFSINISTDAAFMIIGDELPLDRYEFDLDVGEKFQFKWGPVIGFGPATINVLGVFGPGGWGFEREANGFIFLFFVLARIDPISLP